MKCSECYWCALNYALSDKVVCCNEKSKNYNQIFSKQERKIRGCDEGQIRREVDYKNITALEFASKYYM